MEKSFLKTLLLSAAFISPLAGWGIGNPYLPLWEHLPDGEPRVFEDPDKPGSYRAYILGSHDVVATNAYCGVDIRLWSAPVDDLENWRDEGAIFTYNNGNQWDIMYAPDMVEVIEADGSKTYYLYPHSRGYRREAMVCKGSRPDGPFEPINLTPDGKATVEGSIFGFDPAVYVDQNDGNPSAFRAYGYWGFQGSAAAELDPATMYSARPGTEIVRPFMPASFRYGELRDATADYPALYADQNPADFNFFEASSIRKVGNKYVMIFSGYSGPDYGLGSTNSTLRYAFADTPLGPWRSGGVLVDSRGVTLSPDGKTLMTTNSGHNTHGSIQKINDQWYVFYHRAPRGFGFARQATVAPIQITADEKPVSEGGKVVITGYDPYSVDGSYIVKAADGNCYPGAEVTSEGFYMYGLPPYRYYSAGYACHLSRIQGQQDAWDIWENGMNVDLKPGDIVGFKYFGFGGMPEDKKGLKAFEGTRKGNDTKMYVYLTTRTDKPFKIAVWLDGPWDNSTWNGKRIGQIEVKPQAGMARYMLDVAEAVDHLDKKHAIYFVAEGDGNQELCDFIGFEFTKRGQKPSYSQAPKIQLYMDGVALNMPANPVRCTRENGITGYDQYEVTYNPASMKKGKLSARNTPHKGNLKSEIGRMDANGVAVVKCTYNGVTKTYTVKPRS